MVVQIVDNQLEFIGTGAIVLGICTAQIRKGVHEDAFCHSVGGLLGKTADAPSSRKEISMEDLLNAGF